MFEARGRPLVPTSFEHYIIKGNWVISSIKMSILQLKGVHGCQIQNVNIHVNGSARDGRIIKWLFPIFPLARIAINRSFHIGYARFVGITKENRS